MIRLIVLLSLLIVFTILNGCGQSKMESENKIETNDIAIDFIPHRDLYKSCLNTEGLFSYLRNNLNGTSIDYSKVPEDWICLEALDYLLQKSNSNLPCGEIGDILVANSAGYGNPSIERKEAIKLMNWFLFKKKIVEHPDNVIINMVNDSLNAVR